MSGNHVSKELERLRQDAEQLREELNEAKRIYALALSRFSNPRLVRIGFTAREGFTEAVDYIDKKEYAAVPVLHRKFHVLEVDELVRDELEKHGYRFFELEETAYTRLSGEEGEERKSRALERLDELRHDATSDAERYAINRMRKMVRSFSE